MNALVIGRNTQPLLQFLPEHFLLIDDGSFAAHITFPKRRAVTRLNLETDSINPLKDMDYRRAVEFVSVLNAVFPEGENTLTKANGLFHIFDRLTSKPPRLLDQLVPAPDKDTGIQWAYQRLQRILRSPVLERVLNRPTNVSLKGTVIATLNRAELGDFDAFLLGNLLISLYPGPVVIPNFEFYACGFHRSLIQQNRLIAGITSFDQVPDLASDLILIEKKIGNRCTPDDAKILALYAGIIPGTNGYAAFIDRAVRGT